MEEWRDESLFWCLRSELRGLEGPHSEPPPTRDWNAIASSSSSLECGEKTRGYRSEEAGLDFFLSLNFRWDFATFFCSRLENNLNAGWRR